MPVKGGNDPASATGLSAEALRQLAYDRGISIWVMHLRTPVEYANHSRAESLYKELSFFPGIGDFYYGVELGEVDEFGTVLEVLANQITQQVLATSNEFLRYRCRNHPGYATGAVAGPRCQAG